MVSILITSKYKNASVEGHDSSHQSGINKFWLARSERKSAPIRQTKARIVEHETSRSQAVAWSIPLSFRLPKSIALAHHQMLIESE